MNLKEIVTSVSEKTGVSENMTQIILEEFYRFNAGQSRTGAEVVRNFIRYLLSHDRPIKEYLNHAKIENSDQIGEIIMLFCESGLIRKEASDSVEDFEGLFETENIQEYMKSVGLVDYKKRFRKIGSILLGLVLAYWIINSQSLHMKGWEWPVGILSLIGFLLYSYPLRVLKVFKRDST